MYLAAIIVLLHSFIPHHHHSELKSLDHLEEHKSANSIVDLLALAFHFEQHDGQLEKYDAGNEFEPNFDYSFDFIVENPYILNDVTTQVCQFPIDNFEAHHDAHCYSVELRGPPSVG
jgi:hypothetical protein